MQVGVSKVAGGVSKSAHKHAPPSKLELSCLPASLIVHTSWDIEVFMPTSTWQRWQKLWKQKLSTEWKCIIQAYTRGWGIEHLRGLQPLPAPPIKPPLMCINCIAHAMHVAIYSPEWLVCYKHCLKPSIRVHCKLQYFYCWPHLWSSNIDIVTTYIFLLAASKQWATSSLEYKLKSSLFQNGC